MYVKIQRQDNQGVSPLKEGGQLHPDRAKKCEIFTKIFSQSLLKTPTGRPIQRVQTARAIIPTYPRACHQGRRSQEIAPGHYRFKVQLGSSN